MARVKELLKLPFREWHGPSEYDSLYVINSGKKHDSGWAVMAIVGIRNGEPVEIAAHCDDINWIISPRSGYSLRTDCEYPSGILHFWRHDSRFIVGSSLSSTDVTVRDKDEN